MKPQAWHCYCIVHVLSIPLTVFKGINRRVQCISTICLKKTHTKQCRLSVFQYIKELLIHVNRVKERGTKKWCGSTLFSFPTVFARPDMIYPSTPFSKGHDPVAKQQAEFKFLQINIKIFCTYDSHTYLLHLHPNTNHIHINMTNPLSMNKWTL